MQIVNVKHFVDHYVRILPEFSKRQFSGVKENFSLRKQDSDTSSAQKIFSRRMGELQKILNEEIEDCIDSVAKLAPLVPDYLSYN